MAKEYFKIYDLQSNNDKLHDEQIQLYYYHISLHFTISLFIPTNNKFALSECITLNP